jgi:hypothetical protein
MSYAASFRLQPALTIDEATAMNGRNRSWVGDYERGRGFAT